MSTKSAERNYTVTDSQSRELMGWGTFEDLERTLRARLFGEMVALAQPVVDEYHSDLYHDVHWIDEHVNGETAFWFAVRTSGTHVGDMAKIAAEAGSPGLVLYRLTLTCDERNMWHLTVETVEVDR